MHHKNIQKSVRRLNNYSKKQKDKKVDIFPISDEYNTQTDEDNINFANKLIIHPSFKETINELSKLNIDLPEFGSEENWDFNQIQFPQEGNIVSNIDEIKPYSLDPKNGMKFVNSNYPIFAYDESFEVFFALEGTGYIFSHSIVVHGKKDYIPSILITFYFFTRSKMISSKSKFIIESNEPSIDSKKMYANDRTNFIMKTILDNSIIFIDGPLIGGQLSHLTVNMNQMLLSRNIIPIYIVKNSNSNLVTQYLKVLNGKYNSDMHWCYNTLKIGERTNFFSYVDKYKPSNGKVFCYLKSFNESPQRIEMHIETFNKYKYIINGIMDLIYYLILVQGYYKNPQIRTIAIAEKFARESLKMFNIQSILKKIRLIPTINELRFKR